MARVFNVAEADAPLRAREALREERFAVRAVLPVAGHVLGEVVGFLVTRELRFSNLNKLLICVRVHKRSANLSEGGRAEFV